ncbi:MAG: family transcriptional regulator, cyclic receptor protein [Solirubrobacteraceae bacterium]|nr:family transcriptional regulator, cyclic receptor protein [Solirubrobacteraceae bacterium]
MTPTFLSLLADDDRDALLAIGGQRRFPTGQRLMHQGEPGDRVMVIIDGHVKTSFVDADGREVVLSFLGPGDVLGELSFTHVEPRSASVTALNPVVASALTATDFRGFLERRPAAAIVLIDVISRRFRDANRKRVQSAGQDTMGRLATRLVELSERYGEPGEDGVAIGLPITQADLCGWIASSRAGVAAALRTMRELGWIRTERRRMIVLDVEAITQRAG